MCTHPINEKKSFNWEQLYFTRRNRDHYHKQTLDKTNYDYLSEVERMLIKNVSYTKIGK